MQLARQRKAAGDLKINSGVDYLKPFSILQTSPSEVILDPCYMDTLNYT